MCLQTYLVGYTPMPFSRRRRQNHSEQTRGKKERNPLHPVPASLGLGATASLAGAMNDVWWHRTWSSGGKLGKKQEEEYGSKKRELFGVIVWDYLRVGAEGGGNGKTVSDEVCKNEQMHS